MTRTLSIFVAALAIAGAAAAQPDARPQAVTLKQIRDGVARTKDKWIGKRVKVSGTSDGVSSSTNNGSDTTVVRVKMKLADGSFQLSCRMEVPQTTTLPDVGFGNPITFVGTIKGDGTDLYDCTYTGGARKKK